MVLLVLELQESGLEPGLEPGLELVVVLGQVAVVL
jgi:hypothetical protein